MSNTQSFLLFLITFLFMLILSVYFVKCVLLVNTMFISVKYVIFFSSNSFEAFAWLFVCLVQASLALA